MLEIGLWRSIDSLAVDVHHDENARAFRDHLIATASRDLPSQTGRIYADATMRCLRIRHTTTATTTTTVEEDSRKTLQQVIEDLGKCII